MLYHKMPNDSVINQTHNPDEAKLADIAEEEEWQ